MQYSVIVALFAATLAAASPVERRQSGQQNFAGNLGGGAPGVVSSFNGFAVDGVAREFAQLFEALNESCRVQSENCSAQADEVDIFQADCDAQLADCEASADAQAGDDARAAEQALADAQAAAANFIIA